MMQKLLLVPLFCRCLIPIPFLQDHWINPNAPSATFSSSEAIAFKSVSSDDDDTVGKGRFFKSSNDVAEDGQLLGIPYLSSSVPMVSDLSNNIYTAATVEGDGLIARMFQLSGIIKKLKKSSDPNAAQISSRFLIIKGFLSEGIHLAKYIIFGQVKTLACLYVYFIYFGEIRNPISQLRGVRPYIKQLKEATELIVEGSIMCCTQIKL